MSGLSLFQKISYSIRKQLDIGIRKFIVFPYGDMGCLTKKILDEQYQITDYILVDNVICRYNPNVFSFDDIKQSNDIYNNAVLLVSTNYGIYEELLEEAGKIFDDDHIIDVFEEEYKCWLDNKLAEGKRLEEEQKELEKSMIGILQFQRQYAEDTVMDRYATTL